MNVIISGASRGIGREVVKLAANNGHCVLAIARSQSSLDELQDFSGNISILQADLIKDDIFNAITTWSTKVGKIDVLINNAGQLINLPFMETTPEDFVSQFNANVVSAVKLSQSAVPHFNAKGHIVNVTSMGGYQTSSKYAGLSAYSSSKGALSVLTECLAEELRDMEISVNALALGAVQTEMLEQAFPGFQAPISAAEMAKYILNFGLTAHQYYNGKILPVTNSNP